MAKSTRRDAGEQELSTQSDAFYHLTTRDGREYALRITPHGADFSGIDKCPHCGGHATPSGFTGGMRPVRVIRGELYPNDRWLPCGRCVFGAARKRALQCPRYWEDHPDAIEDSQEVPF